MEIIKEDITKINVEVIVNAANGFGFMGGIIARYIKCRGLSENLNFITKGKLEENLKKKVRKLVRKIKFYL